MLLEKHPHLAQESISEKCLAQLSSQDDGEVFSTLPLRTNVLNPIRRAPADVTVLVADYGIYGSSRALSLDHRCVVWMEDAIR